MWRLCLQRTLMTLLTVGGDGLQPTLAADQVSPLAIRDPSTAPASAEPSNAGASRPSGRSGVASPFRVYIDNLDVAKAATGALTGASEWLARETCQSVFSEFLDERGSPLREKLRRLKTTPQHYLGLVVFLDGERLGPCTRDGVLAFTAPHSRVVYLCGRDFERHSRRSAQDAQTVVIHELLHTLGLGENPPTSREITRRVRQRCWH